MGKYMDIVRRTGQRNGNVARKGTGGYVWQLSDAKASELEAVFATPSVVKRTCLRAPHRQNGSVWYPVDKWLSSIQGGAC
jgi:hypothetical protein